VADVDDRDDSGVSEAGGGVRFRPIPPGEEPRHLETLRRWAEAQGGRARITGRIAQNTNPVIHELGGARVVELAWWWLHVGGAPAEYSAFNSRSDRLLHSWRDPFQRRAIIPASWYVEKGRRFALPGGEEFGIAAITTGAASGLLSYSMVTRSALGEAARTHDRMPLVLPRALHDEWLDPGRPGDESLVATVTAGSERIARELTPIRGAHHSELLSPASDAATRPTLF